MGRDPPILIWNESNGPGSVRNSPFVARETPQPAAGAYGEVRPIRELQGGFGIRKIGLSTWGSAARLFERPIKPLVGRSRYAAEKKKGVHV